MKKIHLLRHAKSDWGDASLDDIKRPLNARGIRTASAMALELVNAGCSFEHVFCSPAVRAQSTITLIGEQLPNLQITWEIATALYTFESEHLHQWCQSLDESINELLIVGHNPALTHFSNALNPDHIDNIPTCGYVQLQATKSCLWSEVSSTLFEVHTFLKPKALGIN